MGLLQIWDRTEIYMARLHLLTWSNMWKLYTCGEQYASNSVSTHFRRCSSWKGAALKIILTQSNIFPNNLNERTWTIYVCVLQYLMWQRCSIHILHLFLVILTYGSDCSHRKEGGACVVPLRGWCLGVGDQHPVIVRLDNGRHELAHLVRGHTATDG